MSVESYTGTTYSPQTDSENRPLRLLLLVLMVLLAAAGGGLLGGTQPLLGALLVLAAILVPALIMQSETATMTVIFILYSNIAVVANKFHGVPYFVAASFPFLLFIPLASYLVLQRKPVILHRSLPFLFAFLGVQCLGAVFSRDTQVSVSAVIDFIVEGLVIYLLVTNVVRSPRTLRRVTWTLLLAGVLLAGIPIWQQLTGTYANDYWGYAQLSESGFRTGEISLFGDVRQFKAAGAIGEQNRYAQVMLMLVPLGLFTFWAERKGGLRILALVATMLALVAVAISFSRGAAVALFLLLVAMVFMRAIKLSRFLLVLAAVVLFVISLPA